MTASALFYREPAYRWSWFGVFAASIIPVFLGAICFAASLYSVDSFMRAVIYLPLALAFIVGAPLIAMLSARQVRQRQPLSYGAIFGISLARASSAQFIFFCVHTAVFAIYFANSEIADTDNRIRAIMIMTAIAFGYHLIIWICATLPLTFICTWISRWVSLTRRPRGASVEFNYNRERRSEYDDGALRRVVR